MLYTLLTLLFALLCLSMILVILMQKGKSGIGLGSLGGGTQLLFGGSGGQDLFQKATWVMGFMFMFGSLFLVMLNRPEEAAVLQDMDGQAGPTMPQQDS